MIVRDLLAQGRRALTHEAAARLESETLLAHVLDVDRAWLYANPDKEVPAQPREAYLRLVGRREAGEPIAYLTGRREFWSLTLRVTPDVLIPRAETELLIEAALARIPRDADWRIADIGTGSGAIALAIAGERPGCEVHATESSAAALEVAKRNATDLHLERIAFHRGSWLEPLDGRFDLLVSNPPYVASNDPHLQRGDCRFEPPAALTPGPDGMAAIRHIAEAAFVRLRPGGWLLFEHGYDQGEAARKALEASDYEEIATLDDLEGRERVSIGRKPAA